MTNNASVVVGSNTLPIKSDDLIVHHTGLNHVVLRPLIQPTKLKVSIGKSINEMFQVQWALESEERKSLSDALAGALMEVFCATLIACSITLIAAS